MDDALLIPHKFKTWEDHIMDGAGSTLEAERVLKAIYLLKDGKYERMKNILEGARNETGATVGEIFRIAVAELESLGFDPLRKGPRK